MTADELAKWASHEINALISIGLDPLDAQNTVKRVLAKLPENADPRTWLPPVPGGNVEIDEAHVLDARADYYADEDVPDKFRMLIDAVETEIE